MPAVPIGHAQGMIRADLPYGIQVRDQTENGPRCSRSAPMGGECDQSLLLERAALPRTSSVAKA